MSTEALHVYSICFTKFDSITQLHGNLSKVRKNYFESGVSEKQVIIDESGGVRTKFSYYISKWGMGWKKMLGDQLMEYSVPEQSGTAILYQDVSGHPYAKAFYGRDLEWIRTTYFEEESDTPAYSLEMVDDNVMLLKKFDKDGINISETRLYPGFSDIYSEDQKLLDEKSGVPEIYAFTSKGEVCFCSREQIRLRNDAMEEVNVSFAPGYIDDIMVPSFDWDEEGTELFAECMMLLMGENPEEHKGKISELAEQYASDIDDEEVDLEATIKETERWIASLKNKNRGEISGDIYSYSSHEAFEKDSDLAEIMDMINSIEKGTYDDGRSIGKSLEKELEKAGIDADKKPTRYMVAGKKLKGRAVVASDVFTDAKVIAG